MSLINNSTQRLFNSLLCQSILSLHSPPHLHLKNYQPSLTLFYVSQLHIAPLHIRPFTNLFSLKLYPSTHISVLFQLNASLASIRLVSLIKIEKKIKNQGTGIEQGLLGHNLRVLY